MTDQTVLDRLDRVESQLAIQQLAARYALALDSRDLDRMIGLFVEDVKVGTGGVGREALKSFFKVNLSGFYRSMHLIAGHVIEFDDTDHAHGVVHCRAEHEDGDRWGIMVMNYKDTYERRGNQWFFTRRRLQPLYTTDILERPHGPNFNQGWGTDSRSPDATEWGPRLPGEYTTFARFWQEFPREQIARLTVDPVDADQ